MLRMLESVQEGEPEDKDQPKGREEEDMEAFIAEETLGVIQQVLEPTPDESSSAAAVASGAAVDESVLMPPPNSTYLQLRHHLSELFCFFLFYYFFIFELEFYSSPSRGTLQAYFHFLKK